MTLQTLCASLRSPERRFRRRRLSVPLAVLVAVLLGVAGCSGGAAPDAASTTAPATTARSASAAATTPAPLPGLGTATLEGKRYRLELYKLPEKVDPTVWTAIESRLRNADDGVLTVVDIEKRTAPDSGLPAKPVADGIAEHRDRLAVLTQPVQDKAPPDNPLGDAGSLIFAAAKYRFSDYATSGAVVLALAHVRPLCADACKKLFEDAAVKDGFYPLTWQPFADAVLTAAGAGTTQTAATGSTVTTTPASAPPSTNGGGTEPLPWIIVGVLAAILLAGLALVLRGMFTGRSDPAPPARGIPGGKPAGRAELDPAARAAGGGRSPWAGGGEASGRPRTGAASPSGLRVAQVHPPDVEVGQRGLVHSEFRETGYVSVDGALYRAVWKGSAQARPRIGESVTLYADRGDGLQAWPLVPSDSRHRRAAEK